MEKPLKYPWIIAFGILLALGMVGNACAGAVPALDTLLGYQGGSNNNPHNLSSQATHGKLRAVNDGSTDSTRICVYCHTPHGATAQSTLWNRFAPSGMGTFPLYNQTAIAIDDPAIVGTSRYKNDGSVEYPNGATKLCLSCHDGATAVGTLVNGTAITMEYSDLNAWVSSGSPQVNPNVILSPANFNLTHPVSFVYNGDVVTHINGPGGKSGYALPADPDVRLDGQQRMQCTTCHDPHVDTRNVAYSLPFWRNTDTGFDAGNGGNNDYDNTCKECHTTGTPTGVPHL